MKDFSGFVCQPIVYHQADDGSWSYPGGRVEIDETVEEAARREVYEECGLRVGDMELLGVFSGPELNHVYPTGDEVCGIDIVYVSRSFTGVLKPLDGEARQMGFYPPNRLPTPISAMNRPQLNAFLRSLGEAEI